MPLPRGKALGRARLPLVVWRPVVPRVEVDRVVPREGPEYLGVGFDETVLGGFSTNDVSVVLHHKSIRWATAADRVAHRKLASPSLDGRICSLSSSDTLSAQIPLHSVQPGVFKYLSVPRIASPFETIPVWAPRRDQYLRTTTSTVILLGSPHKTHSYSSRTGNSQNSR